MFVDEATIFVTSGKGGSGAVSFHKEKYRPRGGPDGGDGGRGGSIILRAVAGLASLSALRDHPHHKASSGGNGERNNRTGADAKDVVIPVPAGTLVREDEGTVIADLAQDGDEVVVAKGGRGGRGNAAFKTSDRRLPGFGELGEPGQERKLALELRLIADIAVIGYPNAGKSSLVVALSAARPKVAAYAFTTIEPSLGVVDYAGERFVICDIPGLIEGAHQGKGLGIKFLRHAERSLAFVHVIDLSKQTDLLEEHSATRRELGSFDRSLLDRPEVIVLNKSDEVEKAEAQAVADRFREKGHSPFVISALTHSGLDELLEEMAQVVTKERARREEPQGFELFKTEADKIEVKKEDAAFRVDGSRVRRWVAMTDMSNTEAVAFLQHRLERAGVEKLLEQAGAHHGDEVRISDVVFEWWPTGSAQQERSDERRRPDR
ncbi:MAG: GTPase ObgE [Actinomycetota bacterium]|nr:GTPase ObgE [Actinomycetota bacterium]